MKITWLSLTYFQYRWLGHETPVPLLWSYKYPSHTLVFFSECATNYLVVVNFRVCESLRSCLQTKWHLGFGKLSGSFRLLSPPLALAKLICLIIQLPHWTRAGLSPAHLWHHPLPQPLRGEALNFRLGGGLRAVNWMLSRAVLSAGVIWSRTGSGCSCCGFVCTGCRAPQTGEGFYFNSQAMELQL